MKTFLKNMLLRLIGIETNSQYLEKLKSRGLVVGKNFNFQKDVIFDDTHCWLISIGDNVTIAPRVQILCHDTSTKYYLNYTKLGPVSIGNNVFIGANSIIMPSVTIGNNVIIGSGSIVTKDVLSGSVIAGSPARVLGTIDSFILKNKEAMNNSRCYDESYTMRGNVTDELKEEMLKEIKSSPDKTAFII
jgi:maltose O-acetyltransferase